MLEDEYIALYEDYSDEFARMSLFLTRNTMAPSATVPHYGEVTLDSEYFLVGDIDYLQVEAESEDGTTL